MRKIRNFTAYHLTKMLNSRKFLSYFCILLYLQGCSSQFYADADDDDDDTPPTRYCENVDLSAFCIIDNHFKLLVKDEWDSSIYKYYPHFRQIVEDLFDEAPWREDVVDPGFLRPEEKEDLKRSTSSTTADPKLIAEIKVPTVSRVSRDASVFTYNDMCELRTVLLPDVQGSGSSPKQFEPNPFKVEITEIHVNGKRLHNHLHLTIKSDPKKKIKYAFIVVNDRDGWAVGDFNTRIPCGYAENDCNCQKPNCHQGELNDTIPCMFTSEKVVSHPGQMMFYSETGVDEIHATWHFAQSTDPNLFTRELHFRTLLLEDKDVKTIKRDCKISYQFNNVKESRGCAEAHHICENSERKGKAGWNAIYDILHPTVKTIGAWDYFPKGFIKRKDVKCHVPLSGEHFIKEEYPTYGITKEKLENKNCSVKFRFKALDSSGPQKVTGALNNLYSAISWTSDAQLYYGIPEIEDMPEYIQAQPNSRTSAVRSVEAKITQELSKLSEFSTGIIDEERCYCPRFGIAPPKVERTVPAKLQLEGRRDHAIQMTIAWVVLVPLAIFSSRFYKETYSKVFFLQEYWWYTMHFLSLLLAMVFMFGGIYGIEVRRTEPYNWSDSARSAHAVFGITAVTLFTLQMLLGVFRVRKVWVRKIQIGLHWFFGILEWVLALLAMAIAGGITAGCMSCGAFATLIIFIIGQVVFFVAMTGSLSYKVKLRNLATGILRQPGLATRNPPNPIHMFKVDKKMNLKPKRSYLPPPVMRIFHKNAPDSKFRIYVLCGYTTFCTICYGTMHLFITLTPHYESCFDYDSESTALNLQIDENQKHHRNIL